MKKRIRIKILIVTMMTILISGSSFAQDDKEINLSMSTVNWMGNNHFGTLKFKEGVVSLKGGQFIGGALTIDMTSLSADSSQTSQEKEALEQHLKSDDFWGTKKYATTRLIITDVIKTDATYTATGTITVKGITYQVPLSINLWAGNAFLALKMDLTHYGIQPGSGSFYTQNEDQSTNNNFTLVISINY